VKQGKSGSERRLQRKRSFEVRSHGFMVRLGGERNKYFWLFCSMVGWNLVIPFVVPTICLDMFFYSSLDECFVD
jgi:hypothetical protein